MSESDNTRGIAHHGPPILTERDVSICLAMSEWIGIARKSQWQHDNWLPNSADIRKSRLFWRLRSGKRPLEAPPPTAYSCPWYELIEDDRPHWAYDVHEWPVEEGEEIDDDEANTVWIAQCPFTVLARGAAGKPTRVGFGPWTFRVWSGIQQHLFIDPRTQAHASEHVLGWWIQRELIAAAEGRE